jgi:hypothetical protein
MGLAGRVRRQARTGQESEAFLSLAGRRRGQEEGSAWRERDGAGLGCNIDVASFSGCLECWFGSGQPAISPSGQASLDGSIEAGRWMVPGGRAGVVLFCFWEDR